MRTILFLILLCFCLVCCGLAFETFFVRLYLLGEFGIGDLFRSILLVSGAAWCIYKVHTGEKA